MKDEGAVERKNKGPFSSRVTVAEHLCSFFLTAAAVLERREDQAPLGLLNFNAYSDLISIAATHERGIDHIVRHDERPMDAIIQLANVTGPVITPKGAPLLEPRLHLSRGLWKVVARHPGEVVALLLFGLTKRPVGFRISAKVERSKLQRCVAASVPRDVHAVFDA